MSDISKIQTNGNTYDVKDATARETADSAQETAKEARDYVDEEITNINEHVDSKVSSVNIGTVTTGDEPSVTNSGTDKDVVMDFVFPQGDSRIVSGSFARREDGKVTLAGSMITWFVGSTGSSLVCICAGDNASYTTGTPNWVFIDANGDGTYTLEQDESAIWYTAIIID